MKTIIFGLNEVSSLAKFYLERDSCYTPYAFSADAKFIKESKLEGLPIIPFELIDKELDNKDYSFFAPLYDNKNREKKANEIIKKGYKLISYISTKANVMTSEIGYNCFIMENNVVQPYSKVGNNVILWSGNHIGHHSVIKDNVFFSSHVVLSGRCQVESYCWFGVNCCIKDNTKISEGSFIAMGSVVTKNTNSNTKYTGNPAKAYGSSLI